MGGSYNRGRSNAAMNSSASGGSHMAETVGQIVVSRTLLDDAPGTEDKFSGGGHGRTARALARAIRQSRDSDQAIGLEGSWGAGKSTIVKLAEKELREGEGDRSYHVFTYDLWMNQTGHFKRSFLEAFLNWSLTAFPDKTAKIAERQKQISNKVKVVESDFFRRFSWFGVATVFFLYFTPILYGWLSPAGFKDPAKNAAAVTIGAQLAWLALALYGSAMIAAVAWAFPWKKSMGLRAGLREAISQSLSIFSKEAEKTTVNQTIRDEDPTQYEFHSIFRGIVSELCGKKDRIVIVFDNIDRLPQSRIPDAWSEVRAAFYDEVNGGAKAKITAIVPYARLIALGAFKTSADEAKSGDAAAGASAAAKPGADDDYLRADVFRKSFDVIFAVAPPVLSDTSAFFTEKFGEATNQAVGEDIARRVYRIFDLHVQNSGSPVTPRQVIAFINDVTNWWEQWEGRIPLETIAVFVAHQDKLLANPTLLRDVKAVDARMIQHAGQPDARRDLAALSFNVEPDLAFQILLHEAIRRALIAPEVGDLQKLVDSADANGFFEILPGVIDENLSEIAGTPADYLKGINNVAELKGNLDDLRYTRSSFVNAFSRFNEAALAKWLDHDAIWKLIGFVERRALPDLVQRFMRKIAGAVGDEAKATFDQGGEWIKVIDKLLVAVEAHHGTDARAEIAKSIVPPRSAETIIGIAYDCDQTSCHVRDFGNVPIQTAVFEHLGEYAKGAAAFGYAWPELEFLATAKQKRAMLQNAVNGLQSAAQGFGSDELNWYFEAVTLLSASLARSDGGNDIVPASLYESGALTHYAYGAWQKEGTVDNQNTADALWLAMLAYGFEPPPIADPGNRPVFGDVQAADNAFRTLFTDAPDEGLVRKLSALAIEHGRIDYCFERACEEEEGELFGAVARAICKDEALALPRAQTLIAHFGDLQTILGETMEALAAFVGTKAAPDYWDSLSPVEVPAEMLKFAMEREEPGWRTFIDKLGEQLQAADQAVWRSAFASGGNMLALLMIRNASAPVALAPAEFYEPFLGNCLAIIAGKQKTSSGLFDFDLLAASLTKQSQSRIAKDFFEQHDAPSTGIALALEVLAPLLSALPFEKMPDRTIERYLLPLIKSKSPKADAFIVNQQKSFRASIKSASEQNRGLVQEYLPEKIAPDEEEASEPNERVATLRRALAL